MSRPSSAPESGTLDPTTLDPTAFRALCEMAFDGVFVHEAGRILYVNEGCARLFGRAAEELVGRRFIEFIPAEDQEQVMRHGFTQDYGPFETSGLHSDGTTFPVEVCAVTAETSRQRLVGLRDISERKHAELELQRRDERFQSLVQAAFVGVVLEDEKGIEEVNESFTQTFGFTSEELRGRRVESLVVAADSRHEPGRTRDVVMTRKDGTSLIAQICTATTSTGEEITAVRDVSQERRAQADILESERRYRELSETTNDLLCVHDLEGRVVDLNLAGARALGGVPEEYQGKNIREFLDARTLQNFDQYIVKMKQNGRAEGLMAVITKSGERRLWHFQNLLRTRGEETLVHGQARDVTDRETALYDLRKSEHHFRSIIENVSDLVTVLDPDGSIRYVSPSVTRAIGLDLPNLVGRSYADMVHPDEVPEAGAVFMRQLTQPDAVGSLDARILHGDGTYKWYSIVTTNHVIDGRIAGVIVNARDITERRLLISQLEQANRVNGLGRLAATVAHEFNNVLMGMQPFAELMQRPHVPHEMAAKGAGYIASSIARGKRVALDILRFTQPAQPDLGRVVLRDWWARLLPELKAGTENSIRLIGAFDPQMAVVADEGQLSQIFANLVSNARHAMPLGGDIVVTARRPREDETFPFGVVRNAEECVQLSVTDTGCGIPADILGNVFDPLFTTRRNGGTGLGLAVVHQIVTNHQGAIFVESEVGVGTTFHVFLRADTSQSRWSERERAAPQPQLHRKARILIIDDEDAVAEGLAAVLDEEGMETSVAASSAEGVAEAERFRPDVVLIDVGLPDANGAETALQLHARYPGLKVLIMSGHADAAGVLPDDLDMRFLQKPFPIDALLEVLEAFEHETSN